MIGEPPSLAGALHEKATCVLVVDSSFLTKLIGGSGAIGAIGIFKLPIGEVNESPITLNAITLVYMVSKSPKLKGSSRKVSSTEI